MAIPFNPPTHQTICPPMGGGVSTDFKSSNRTELSRFVKFYWIFTDFGGPPLGMSGWVCGRVGVLDGVKPHTCVHACHDKHVGGHLQFLYMYILACTCMCVCVHMYACVGGTPISPDTPTTLPPPPELQGSQISKNTINLNESRQFNSVWRFGTSALSCTHID